MNTQKGFSLTELMVSLLIATIITAVVIQVFLANKQMYRVQDAWSRMQENGRYAMNTLSSSIHSAGYYGCATRSGVSITNTLNNNSTYLWDFSFDVFGFNGNTGNTWTPTLDSSISSPNTGTDVFTIKTAFEPAIIVTAHPGNPSQPPGSADLQIVPNTVFDQHDIVMVTDCLSSAIFQITNANPQTSGNLVHNTGSVSAGPGNSTKDLGKDYTGAHVYKMATVSYYIKDSDGIPSLFRKVGDANADAIIEGVEDMQILYGIDSDGDSSVDSYVDAATMTDWDEVLSVQIHLLLVSLEDNLTVSGQQQYYFNGAPHLATDNKLRVSFTETITLRNRVP